MADNGNGNLLLAQSATLSQAATVQTMSFYVTSAAGKLRLGIYDASGPGAGPGMKLAETPEISASPGWNTASVTPTNLLPGSYWLAYLPSDNGLGFVKVPGNSNSKLYSYAYGTLPTTFATGPRTSGSHWSLYATLTATAGSPNLAPTLAAPASANPSFVSAASTQLSALGADDGGESALTYTWSVTGTPPAPVTWSPNASNAAKSSTATFSKAGSYDLVVTARDASGLTAQSTVNVAVNQTLSSIAVAPATASVSSQATQQFSALATDQFGSPMAAPAFSWSVTGGGVISSNGLFTAGAGALGPFAVRAVSGAVTGSASVTVSAPPASGSVVIGESAVLATLDNGNANLLVAQSATLTQSASLQSLSFYVAVAAGKLRLGVYDASGPSGGPGHKLAETAEMNANVGWNTAIVTPIDLSAGSYWLAYFASDNNLAFVKSPGNSNSKLYSYPYGVLPTSYATNPNSSGSHWSLYATLSSTGPIDPCAGLTCTAPPAPLCSSGTTRRSYSSPGTCNNGSCSYAATDQPCPVACQNGACVSGSGGMPGPLSVSANPNYFQDTTGRAVALFGSHTWNNFQDWGTSGAPQAFDFSAYTNFLVAHGHNFTFLWRTELPKFCALPTQAANSPDITTTLQPWLRTGPGSASDGGAKFDLGKFDQTYFDRLRARVAQLNSAGVWVGVYLFTGEWLNAFRCPSDGYPLTGSNNVNAIDDGGGNGSMTMSAPNPITDIQDALVDKTIDTLSDLPNVLWIVSEEANANTLWWQQHTIAHVRVHENTKPYKHPVGFATMEYGTPDSAIFNSNADWVAPIARLSSSSTCGSGSPSCKVNINDSDHSYYGMWSDSKQANRQYAWENFARGNQVAFMDPYTVYYPRESRNLCASPINGMCAAPDSRWDNFRDNLGYLVAYSRRLNLNAAHARDPLCSTSYCLGQTPAIGTELLIYAPTGGTFSVNLSSAAGRTMNYEWFDPDSGRVISTGTLAGGNASQAFSTPGSIPADSVLYVVDSAGHG